VLNYNHLHYFHVAATAGSLAQAAQKLGVTQPTVSEQLRALERTLGVSLFQRSPSGLKLTDMGRLAFEQTSVMFRAGERLVEALGHSQKVLPSTLRVGVSTAVARSITTDFLLPLLEMEGCVPTIETGEMIELMRRLRSSDLDLALTESDPPQAARRGLIVAMVDQPALVAVAPPDVSPDHTWENVGLVHYRATSTYRWDVESFLDENGFRPNIVAESDDPIFLVQAAMRGGYVTVVPRPVARDALSAGKLQQLARVKASEHSGIHALYQDATTTSLARRAVELLIDVVKKRGES